MARTAFSAAARAVALSTLLPAVGAHAGVFPEFDWIGDTGVWTSIDDWSLGTWPQGEVSVFIGRNSFGPNVTLNVSTDIAELDLRNGAELDLAGHRLHGGAVGLHGGLVRSRLIVPTATQIPGDLAFRATGLDVNDSDVILEGGVIELTASSAIDSSSEIRGFGRINAGSINHPFGVKILSNDGTIRAMNGILTVAETGDTDWIDLDGNGVSAMLEMNEPGTELHITGQLAPNDPYSGGATIAGGARLFVEEPFDLDGWVVLHDDDPGHAELDARTRVMDGAHVIVQNGTAMFPKWFVVEDGGRLKVEAGAQLTVQGYGQFADDATVTVDGFLRWNNDLTLFGTHVDGLGDLEVNGDFIFTGASYLELPQGHVDLDGVDENNLVVIDTDAFLRIDARNIDADGGDGSFDGMMVNKGDLLLQTQSGLWNTGGSMRLDATVPGAPPEVTVSGSRTRFSDGSDLRVFGTGRFWNDTTFDAGSHVILGEDATLILTGDSAWYGGSVTGAGTLQTDTEMIVVGDVDINVARLHWDGPAHANETTVHHGHTLAITTDALGFPEFDDGYDGIADIRGTLAITTPAPWELEGELIVHDDATVTGSALRINEGGVLRGSANEMMAGVLDVPVTVEANGRVDVPIAAMLAFNEPLTLDTNDRTTDALGGTGAVMVRSSMHVESDARIDLSLFDWDGMDGDDEMTTTIARERELIIRASALDSVALDGVDGSITLGIESILDVDLAGASYWTLDGTLRMHHQSVVRGDDVFVRGEVVGGGTFLGANLVNRGTVRPLDGDGSIHVTNAFADFDGGVLHTTLRGPELDLDYGRVHVSGAGAGMELGGTLRIELDGYVPEIGQLFVIADAPSMTGAFSTIDAPGFVVHVTDPSDLLPAAVIAEFVGLPCPEDVNRDGVVDFNDLVQVLAAWGPCTASPCATDVDQDAETGFSDLVAVLAAWGACS